MPGAVVCCPRGMLPGPRARRWAFAISASQRTGLVDRSAFFGSQLSIDHIAWLAAPALRQEVFVFSYDSCESFSSHQKSPSQVKGTCPKTRFHIRGFFFWETIWMPAPEALLFPYRLSERLSILHNQIFPGRKHPNCRFFLVVLRRPRCKYSSLCIV